MIAAIIMRIAPAAIRKKNAPKSIVFSYSIVPTAPITNKNPAKGTGKIDLDAIKQEEGENS